MNSVLFWNQLNEINDNGSLTSPPGHTIPPYEEIAQRSSEQPQKKIKVVSQLYPELALTCYGPAPYKA